LLAQISTGGGNDRGRLSCLLCRDSDLIFKFYKSSEKKRNLTTVILGKNITKSFSGNDILRGIDIKIEPGKITTLIGPSGGGKTTLLCALSLLNQPTTGEIMVDDTSYHFPLENGKSIKPPWPYITAVFQQLFLWPHLTLRQNITLPLINNGIVREDAKGGFGRIIRKLDMLNLFGHSPSPVNLHRPLHKKTMAEVESDLEKLVALFEMADFIDRYPNETSLGQKQRVALARALMLEPKYILLDEITSALDVEQVSAILSHLQTLRDNGIGILAITHLIGFAHRAADRIYFLDDGKIIEEGGTELLDSPKHERVQRFLSVIESAT
jgi:polar amino acid transport system ATP-binding protein